MGAVVLPIPFDNPSLITEDSLGQGFTIDKASPLRNKVFKNVSKEHIQKDKQVYDSTTLRLINGEESLRNALGVGGEISLSYGLISGRVMGDYLKESSSKTQKLTMLCSRSIKTKILTLKDSCPINPHVSEKVKDLQTLRRDFGGYYVHKIQYGAKMDVKITLESSDKATLESIKGELEGGLSIGALSLKVKAHLDKHDSTSSSHINVASEVWMMGAEQVHRTDIKNLDEAVQLIDNFKVDDDALCPVAIEVMPIPADSVPLLSFTDVFLDQYMAKVKEIGAQYWVEEELKQQLLSFKAQIAPLENDLSKAVFAQRLMLKINTAIDDLTKRQQDSTSFLQNKSVEHIANNPVPYSDADMTATTERVHRLIGRKVLFTPQGKWQGPAIDDIPIYAGTYIYDNGTTFSGLCLDGKREGAGTLTFTPGNEDGIASIDGTWKADELTYPSTINFADSKTRILASAADAAKWREEQRAKKVADSVIVRDMSTMGEYRIRLRVYIDKNHDKEFEEFYRSMLREKKNDTYYYMFMGMTGAGKTTVVEYLLNVLTGQVHAAKTLRAQDLEQKDRKPGQSATLKVCCYEVDYVTTDPGGHEAIMLRIVLIDTPGFGDTGGANKDEGHAQQILKTVSKIPKLDNVCYVVAGSLTRATLDQARTLCNVFSILPVEAMGRISFIITFCDNKDQCDAVMVKLDEMLPGIAKATVLYMDNPWSHHKSNAYRDNKPRAPAVTCGKTIGTDNTDSLLTAMSANLHEYVMTFIRQNISFSPKGMAELGQLKADFLELLEKLGGIMKKLEPILTLVEARSEKDIAKLVEKANTLSIAEFLRSYGFAYIHGKPMAKIVSKNPFGDGRYATVCFAPDCLNMSCHIGCALKFTQKKGDNIFRECTAFNHHDTCQVCSSHCSFRQHIHTHCQLEWLENDELAKSYYSLKKGAEAATAKLLELEGQAAQYAAEYKITLNKIVELKDRFKTLAVTGDMHALLKACKNTYEQELQLIRAVETEKNPREAKLVNLIDELKLLIKALEESDHKVEDTLLGRIKSGLKHGQEAAKKVAKKLALIEGQ